jgi:hypothetical protein
MLAWTRLRIRGSGEFLHLTEEAVAEEKAFMKTDRGPGVTIDIAAVPSSSMAMGTISRAYAVDRDGRRVQCR